MTGLHNHQGVSEIPQTDDVIYEPPLMQSAACPDHGTARTHDSPPPSLQSRWLMNGDLPKTFQLYLSLSLMMKGNETFKVYIHHFVFRTSYILYKLQCNIACGGHAVFSIGHISLFTEVKCWLCTFSTIYSPEAALEAQFFIRKCTSL